MAQPSGSHSDPSTCSCSRCFLLWFAHTQSSGLRCFLLVPSRTLGTTFGSHTAIAPPLGFLSRSSESLQFRLLIQLLIPLPSFSAIFSVVPTRGYSSDFLVFFCCSASSIFAILCSIQVRPLPGFVICYYAPTYTSALVTICSIFSILGADQRNLSILGFVICYYALTYTSALVSICSIFSIRGADQKTFLSC